MSIKWYQLLFQLINFGILIFVLNKFLYNPVVKILKQRNKKIEDSLKAAEDNLRQKAKLVEFKKQVTQEAEREAVIVIEQAKAQASKISQDLIGQAKNDAQKEVDKKYSLMLEKLASQEKSLQGKVADLVVSTTRKVLQETLTLTEQKKIIDQEIRNLKKIVKS